VFKRHSCTHLGRLVTCQFHLIPKYINKLVFYNLETIIPFSFFLFKMILILGVIL
jgi:hypothetical protein